MKKRALYSILIFSLLSCIVLVFWYPHLMLSPGILLEGHQELNTDCLSCHSIGKNTLAENCISCHPVDKIGLTTTRGVLLETHISKKKPAFHQKLVKQNCVSCHTEHQGVSAERNIASFTHELLEISVRQHCVSCHQKPEDALHEKNQENCKQCHRETAWRPAAFDHRDYFRFDRHHKADCATCHLDNNFRQYTCYECHEHSPSKIRREHQEEGIYNFENCTECHRSGDEHDAERIWRSKKKPYQSGKNMQSSKHNYHGRKYQWDEGDEHEDHDDDD
ncbi:MAG: class III cytochrome C family protein [SAR324 cluster bacterium]|nr:class III cytochrome C family protein [SAR324 cluster bacterium]